MSLSLLHSPAEVIAQMLMDLGIASDPTGTSAWPVFVSAQPDTPDELLVVTDTSPQDDGRSMIDGETWHHYGFQILIRSQTHKVGYAKADEIHTALDESVYNETITLDTNHYIVQSVSATNLLALGKGLPGSKRSLFSVNARVVITRVS